MRSGHRAGCKAMVASWVWKRGGGSGAGMWVVSPQLCEVRVISK